MHVTFIHTIVLIILQSLYTLSVLGLAIYGMQALWLSYHYLRQQARYRKEPRIAVIDHMDGQAWPMVTVQLPIYNERHVIERLLTACVKLDYPPGKLQIQVLDDSDDQTTAMVMRLIEGWRECGPRVELVRRPTRSGFKAGSLAYGLGSATGEFIAIFDADFVPRPDFLRQMIPSFYNEPVAHAGIAPEEAQRIGFVQARWGHLNGDYSAITRCQTLALDGHFVVEQRGRQAANFAFGFNGSGGIWRRSCIEDTNVGGWQPDTLCEDLDLSYRAQLVGWRPCYRDDVEAPAEVPPQLVAFKRQQFRWAKGSIQTLCKLGRRVQHSDWPLTKRLAALIHLASYLVHPLLLLLLLTSLPLLWMGASPGSHIAILSLASFGPPLLYAIGQAHLYGHSWWRRWLYLPMLTLLGTGICFSNTVAVWQGFHSQGGAFLRTPKFHIEQRRDRWHASTYRLPLDQTFLGECLLLIYAAITTGVAWMTGNVMFGFYLLLYVGGFAMMVFVSLWQARPRRRPIQPLNEPNHRATHLHTSG